MPVEVKLLSATQFMLTTLVVKLAVVAALATMLVRFRQFRRILLTEQRAWRERLVFAAALGLPLCGGVTARLLLNYNASDLSLAGPFLAGLIAGPYAGAIVGALVGAPALVGGEAIAMPFAVGCGFCGGGLREVCPKEAIWRFSPLTITDLHRHAWRMLSRLRLDWHVVLLAAPVGLELLRLGLGLRFGPHLFHMQPPNAWLAVVVILATVLSVTIPIKIWNTARIEHRLQEQEKLLLSTRLEALASQINPHFLFNTLTSISSLIRSQPETDAHARPEAVRAAAAAAAQPGALRDPCARSSKRSTSTSTSRWSGSARPWWSRRKSAPPASTSSCPACCCSRSSRTRSSTG